MSGMQLTSVRQCMRFDAYPKRFFGGMRIRAQVAFVEAFTKMSHSMQIEYVTVGKRLATQIARVWSLTCIFKSKMKLLNSKYFLRMMLPFHDHPTMVPV